MVEPEKIPPFLRAREPVDLSAPCAIGNPPIAHDWSLPELASAKRPRVSEAGTLLPPIEQVIYYRWFCNRCHVHYDMCEVAVRYPQEFTSRTALNLDLDVAVCILNKMKHNELDDWKANHRNEAFASLYKPGRGFYTLSEFEAIACAERYMRERKNADTDNT